MATSPAAKGPTILGMGNPLLDISANVSDEFLDKYSLKLNNAILADDAHLPIYKDLVCNYPVEYIAGGATQNAIRVCQWLVQKPNATAYIGSIGDDSFGEILLEKAQTEGVAVYYHVEPGTPTGTCAVLVRNHERSLVANLAAANSYKYEHMLTPDVQAVVTQAQIFYISGFFLTVSPKSIMHLAYHADANDKMFVMNLAAPFIPEFFMEPLSAALPYCDIVIGNETESATYGKMVQLDNPTPEAVALAIGAIPRAVPSNKKRIVIITQGGCATIVAENGLITKYEVPVVPEAEQIDLNGAGDAFVGGLLACLSYGLPISKAVAAGQYCAGVVIRRSGCTFEGIPKFAM